MTEGQEKTLGDVIDRVRRSKHISVSQLLVETGISRSSYTRIINGQGEPNLEILVKIMSSLHLMFNEIDSVLIPVEQSNVKQAELLGKNYGVRQLEPIDGAGLRMAVAKYQTQADQENTEAGQLVWHLARYLLAKYERDDSGCVQQGQWIFEVIDKYDRWDVFETHLLLEIIPTLSDAQLISGYSRLKDHNRRMNETNIGINFILDNDLYFEFFEQAVARNSYTLLVATVKLVRELRIVGISLQVGILNKFAEITAAMLDHNERLAAATMARLLTFLEVRTAVINPRIDWLNRQYAALQTSSWQLNIMEHLHQRMTRDPML